MNRYARGYSTQSFGQFRTDCLDSRSYVRSKRKILVDIGGYRRKKKLFMLGYDKWGSKETTTAEQSKSEERRSRARNRNRKQSCPPFLHDRVFV
jgi:hypothetical protein